METILMLLTTFVFFFLSYAQGTRNVGNMAWKLIFIFLAFGNGMYLMRHFMVVHP